MHYHCISVSQIREAGVSNLLLWAVYRSLDGRVEEGGGDAPSIQSEILADWKSRQPDWRQLAKELSQIYESNRSNRRPGEPRIVLSPRYKVVKDKNTNVETIDSALWVDWDDTFPDLTRPDKPDVRGIQLLQLIRLLMKSDRPPALPVREV